eukprot:CAMPEP_0183791210 /NCGR_PEP_ID=MMETSP0803_2-20130417/1684_1 /TAXON_ID=195967 /ORGANISM="Crustomastix stigmata, Strain CCMP3273" /LENGTH=207 /DNA_ID=CAMNT_0026035509 /DNA_START=22 /DNA_END=642 /DNA_ORIENTATION=-
MSSPKLSSFFLSASCRCLRSDSSARSRSASASLALSRSAAAAAAAAASSSSRPARRDVPEYVVEHVVPVLLGRQHEALEELPGRRPLEEEAPCHLHQHGAPEGVLAVDARDLRLALAVREEGRLGADLRLRAVDVAGGVRVGEGEGGVVLVEVEQQVGRLVEDVVELVHEGVAHHLGAGGAALGCCEGAAAAPAAGAAGAGAASMGG